MDKRTNSGRRPDAGLLDLDPRDRPLYSLREAAKYLGVPEATLRTWVLGRRYPTQKGPGFSPPLIKTPDPVAGKGPASRPLLSFNNLVEANVLAALRREHAIPMSAVRQMLEYAQTQLNHPRPLLLDLEAGLGDVFLREGEGLLALTRAGQMALSDILELYLKRVERDEKGIPVRFHPPVGARVHSQSVVLDPQVAFGAPTVKGVKTRVIALRYDAGEDLEEIASDYGLEVEEVREAVVFEGASAA